MIRNKKGIVEVQFNWIFVLVVGSVILLLFTVIVLKQKTTAERVADERTLKDMRAIITSATVNLGTTNIVDIGDTEINLECDKIIVGDQQTVFQDMILFSPGKIKGKEFITQTLPFNIPFRAANIIIGSSDEVRYVIQDDGSTLFNDIKDRISNKFNVIYTLSPGGVSDETNYKVRFVYFNSLGPDPTNFANREDDSVTAVVIDTSSGNLNYYKKIGSVWDPSLTDTLEGIKAGTKFNIHLLIAAIFLDDKNDIEEKNECIMSSLIKRVKKVAEVYKDRNDRLIPIKPCIVGIDEIRDNADPELNRFIIANDISSLNTAYSDYINIENLNRDLTANTCTTIY
tara:strand:- start:30745 stop:31770 length:1026 start_codon:yes stop_codon:yes gene_type:complete